MQNAIAADSGRDFVPASQENIKLIGKTRSYANKIKIKPASSYPLSNKKEAHEKEVMPVMFGNNNARTSIKKELIHIYIF